MTEDVGFSERHAAGAIEKRVFTNVGHACTLFTQSISRSFSFAAIVLKQKLPKINFDLCSD